MDSSYFQNDSERNVTIALVIFIIVLLVGGVFVVDAIARCHVRLQLKDVLTPEQKLEQMLMGPAKKFSHGSTTLARGRADDDDDDDDHPECIICISEFVEGEEIKVLLRCKHVFHARCIHRWFLYDKSSCPTCRTSCKKIPFNKNPPAETSQQQLNDVVHDIEAAIPSQTEFIQQQQQRQQQQPITNDFSIEVEPATSSETQICYTNSSSSSSINAGCKIE